jgi:hypothetical protein
MQQAAIQLSLSGLGRPRRWDPAAILAQTPGDGKACGNDRLRCEPEVESKAAGTTPPGGHGAFPQLSSRGEGDAVRVRSYEAEVSCREAARSVL